MVPNDSALVAGLDPDAKGVALRQRDVLAHTAAVDVDSLDDSDFILELGDHEGRHTVRHNDHMLLRAAGNPGEQFSTICPFLRWSLEEHVRTAPAFPVT